MANELAISNLSDVMVLGEALAKSGYFSDVKETAQAVVKILAGQELGIGPVAAMSGLYIYKGRVCMMGSVMSGLIKSSEKYNYVIRDHTEKVCVIEFFEKDMSIGVSEFTIDEADKAGLLKKDNWKAYPADMLFNRALSRGFRRFCPDLGAGSVYAKEELDDDNVKPGFFIEPALETGPELLIQSDNENALAPIGQEVQQVMIRTVLQNNPELEGKTPVEIAQFINERIQDTEIYKQVTIKEVVDAMS